MRRGSHETYETLPLHKAKYTGRNLVCTALILYISVLFENSQWWLAICQDIFGAEGVGGIPCWDLAQAGWVD
jgi:hypothetical protein